MTNIHVVCEVDRISLSERCPALSDHTFIDVINDDNKQVMRMLKSF